MATITWDGGAATQNWQDANNWDTDNVPGMFDDVIIPTGMGTIAGTPSSSVNTLTVNGDSQLNVVLEVTQSVTFNDTSKNLGTINASAGGSYFVTFNSTSENVGIVNVLLGAFAVFNDSTENSGDVAGSGNSAIEFNDSSVNSGNALTVSANVTFSNTSENSATGTADSSAANVIFKDTAENNGTVDAVDVIFGNVSFDNASNAINSGTVTASGSINVYYPSAKPLGGTVTGTITYNNYTRTWTAGGGTWETGSNWTDGAVPGIYADVVIDSNIIVSGTPPSAVVSVTMSNNVFLEVGSLTAGTFTQNGSGRIKNGTFTGTFVFNDDTQNENATLIGDSTFNDDSINLGTITGDAYFYDDSINDNTVSGDAYIRQHAAAFLVWRNKATTTFVTGDIFLQFPEMDILGTGLL